MPGIKHHTDALTPLATRAMFILVHISYRNCYCFCFVLQIMSLKSQIALGKNMTLQRQLDGKYVEFKKAFRSSRRRLDSLEEECITSLYKLITEAKTNTKAGEPDRRENQRMALHRSASVPPRPFSVTNTPGHESVIQERPYTSMSSRTFKQSYSFKRDGLDISKFSRGRRTNETKIKETENKPISVIDTHPDLEQPIHVDINYKRETHRKSAHLSGAYGRVPPTSVQNTIPSDTNTSNYDIPDGKLTDLGHDDGKTRPTSILKQRQGGPVLVHVHESNTQLDEFRPLSVTITQTTPLHHPVYNVQTTPSPTPFRATETPFEEEVVSPVEEPESGTAERLQAKPNSKHVQNRNSMTPQRMSRVPSRTESEESEFQKARSIQERQKFLNDYSKKSKLFGYVVKTKSTLSSMERIRKTCRSPCVTYQELVAIKSSLKQQETRTRMLLKRSAKLSSYVDQLAMASQYRQHIKSLKEEKLSESEILTS